MDLTDGLMFAVPARGAAPAIDGDLKDFDLSGAEPVWISPQTIGQLRANVALMYDDDALYLGATVSLPNRPLKNPNNPSDAFWNGDVLELRLAADPNLPAPLNNKVESDRVAHLTMWKNSETGKDFLNITYGVNLDKGSAANPPGSRIAIVAHGQDFYTIETRIPWSVLKVPGGKNPFAPGQKMTAILSPHWGGETQTAALYRENPGAFAFQQPQTWGQVEFSPTGNLAPRHENLEQLVARFAAQSNRRPVAVGAPFEIEVPATGKVSVNILGARGQVIRELMGGETHPKGKLQLRWDGKDQWGQGVAPGTYRWGAYFSGGLRAQYVGGVGKSGAPYYETEDGKGGWGADHSNPIDVAADASGLYFLWPVAEAGRAVVKTDFSGQVLWRKTPFVGGGFGPFYAIASDGKRVYLTLGNDSSRLVRLDANTGQLQTWGDGGAELPVDEAPLAPVKPEHSVMEVPNVASFGAPAPMQPQSVGLATDGKNVFVPVYAKNLIHVLDAATGKKLRELACPGPRGLALGDKGDLFAVSFVEGTGGKIVRFAGATGAAQTVVSQHLAAPWDVAVHKDGRLFVSDLGDAQQVKVFDAKGRLLKRFGTPGGRAWQGRYNDAGFLHPAGLALDKNGDLLVAESAIPKVFSRLDAQSGAVKQRWFGPPVYWASTWPAPDDPRKVFVPMSGGVAQFTLPPNGGDQARPDAYWALPQAGYPTAGTFETGYAQPEWVRAKNGRDYLVSDVTPYTIALREGDKLRPVAGFRAVGAGDKGNATGKNRLELWADGDGDGRPAPGEITQLETVGGQALPRVGGWTDSLHMEPNGDLYFMTQGNKILKIPAASGGKNGLMKWDANKASFVVPQVLPSRGDFMETSWVTGLHGARVDGAGNLYTVFNTNVGGSGQPYEYATPELAARQKEGLSHTGEYNVVKFAKFDAQGRLLWMAGRKATAAARPGEMYHFWNMAGLVNDRYIAGGSEWGPIYFYTADGFYVDALMNNPGLNPPPGPYTFGGETSGGRVQYFPDRDELWAYSTGMAYRVAGFQNGKVEGEARASGTVDLDRVYEAEAAAPTLAQGPLQMVALAGDAFADATWQNAPVATLARDDAPLASAQLGYDANYLYAKIHVNDASPLQNSADTLATAFKGGDTAGLVLGAAQHPQPGAGDVRFMAAQIGGKARLIAMKTVTNGAKQPEIYSTPAGGEARFEFVGEVPGGRVALTPDATGYTAVMAIPRAFVEFAIAPGQTIRGDIEVRLSGNGQRGIQATSRNYLFTPATVQTTLTDDVPTEARLYPGGWGALEVR